MIKELQGMYDLRTSLQEIRDLSKKEKKSLEQMALKLSEETGEVCQALLSCLNASGCEYKDKNSQDVKEECVDVIIVALSLFYKLEGSNEEMKETVTTKIAKWKEKSKI